MNVCTFQGVFDYKEQTKTQLNEYKQIKVKIKNARLKNRTIPTQTRTVTWTVKDNVVMLLGQTKGIR